MLFRSVTSSLSWRDMILNVAASSPISPTPFSGISVPKSPSPTLWAARLSSSMGEISRLAIHRATKIPIITMTVATAHTFCLEVCRVLKSGCTEIPRRRYPTTPSCFEDMGIRSSSGLSLSASVKSWRKTACFRARSKEAIGLRTMRSRSRESISSPCSL